MVSGEIGTLYLVSGTRVAPLYSGVGKRNTNPIQQKPAIAISLLGQRGLWRLLFRSIFAPDTSTLDIPEKWKYLLYPNPP